MTEKAQNRRDRESIVCSEESIRIGGQEKSTVRKNEQRICSKCYVFAGSQGDWFKPGARVSHREGALTIKIDMAMK